jgi:DNA-binding transcriptional LysR family regulator
MPSGPSIQLNQIEAFVEVARGGSISRAAEVLAVSQPALTARIQGLEEGVGAALFVRTRSGTRLTEAGRALLPYAERALGALEQGRELVGEVAGGTGGRLTIGAAPAVSTYVLPRVLREFQAVHPGVQLSVRSGHSDELLDMVLREEVEVGLMRPIRHPDVTLTPLYTDQLVLVVPPDHRFAGVEGIEMGEMAPEHLILFDRTSSYHELTSSIFREAGIQPRGYIEVDNIDAAKRMVEEGLGIALLPHTSVSGELGDGRLIGVPIRDMTPVRRQIVVVRRRDAGPPTPGVAAFLATLEKLRPSAA